MIDLAGSERIGNYLHDPLQVQQSIAINQSLLTLKECIRLMLNKSNHLPFRRSKLTSLLRNYFQQRSHITMITNVSPTTSCLNESIDSIRYAQMMYQIKKPMLPNLPPLCIPIENPSVENSRVISKDCSLPPITKSTQTSPRKFRNVLQSLSPIPNKIVGGYINRMNHLTRVENYTFQEGQDHTLDFSYLQLVWKSKETLLQQILNKISSRRIRLHKYAMGDPLELEVAEKL